jgi:CheY-like chemotaxis protein
MATQVAEVVTRNDDVLRALRRWLEAWDYDVVQAQDATAAVATAAVRAPSVVLVDLNVLLSAARHTRGTGALADDLATLLGRLRRCVPPSVPIIVSYDEENRAALASALQAGATDYVETGDLDDPVLLRHRLHVAQTATAAAAPGASAEAGPPGRGVRGAGAAADMFALFLPDVHDPDTGRLDAQRIAAYLGVNLTRLAEAIGVNYRALHKTPAAESVQERLVPFKHVLAALHDVYGERAPALAWLHERRPELRGQAPLEVMLRPGEVDAVESLVMNAWLGTPD